MIVESPKRPRSLSHDETKAAEAAFQGQPFDASWSQSARVIYDGILAALRKRRRMDVPLLEFQPDGDAGQGLVECSVSQGEEDSWGNQG